MLFRKIRQILYNKSNWNNNLHHFLISTRLSKKCVSIDGVWALYRGDIRGMSSLRFVLKESSVMRLWSVWRRNYFISTVVRRCRRDRVVRDVLQRFRHTLLRPRQTLLLSATAACKSNNDSDRPPSCKKDITDEELQELLEELGNVKELSKKTLFCARCGKRLVIDRKQAGVIYCSCKEPQPSTDNEGWEPYMEADDVIVWRKLYKPGQPYYAYKVYGRYSELRAQDFAAVQVDGAYRRVWDSGVASLSVVERQANGVDDQTVLHWEVLWPRLFANRDYVYIRRHKEFDVEQPPPPAAVTDQSRPTAQSVQPPTAVTDQARPTVQSGQPPHAPVTDHSRTTVHFAKPPPAAVTDQSRPAVHSKQPPPAAVTDHSRPAVHAEKPPPAPVTDQSRPTVHSHAKRKAMESDRNKEMETAVPGNNRVYIIASRSCEHSKVPHSKHAIRVTEFWSHMVIKTLDGPDKPGMEFVLTYYEEPAGGGLPSGVASWVTGRAAPAFLDRQRQAATHYSAWRSTRKTQDLPDYIEFSPETEASLDADAKAAIREQDMESSKQGPDLETDIKTQDESTQTDIERTLVVHEVSVTTENVTTDKEPISSESDKKSTDDKSKSNTEMKLNTEVLEKCDENVKNSSVTKLNNVVVNNDGQESPKSEQNTRKDAKTEVKKSNENNKVPDTRDGAKSDVTYDGKVAQNGGQDKQDGGQDKQDGGSKKEEKDCEQEGSNNGSWWRYLYPFYYFA